MLKAAQLSKSLDLLHMFLYSVFFAWGLVNDRTSGEVEGRVGGVEGVAVKIWEMMKEAGQTSLLQTAY